MSLLDKLTYLIENKKYSDEKSLFFKLKTLLTEEEPNFIKEYQTQNIAEVTAEFFQWFKKNESQVLKTGFRDFDRNFDGFSLGELVVIGGRPGMGISALLLQLILNISPQTPTLFFSLGMDKNNIILRMLNFLAEIFSLQRIKQQELSQEEYKKLLFAREKLQSLPLYVNDSYYGSLSMFRKECQKYIQEKGVKIIFIDYLQRMAFRREANYRSLEIGTICEELKKIANDFNVCVVVASQLSRNMEYRAGHKRPILSDLSESSFIEQIADKVVFLYRPEYYKITEWDDYEGSSTQNQAELIVAKNRNGGLDNIRLGFEKGCFYDIDKSQYYKMDDFSFSQNRLDELEDFEDDDSYSPF